jgi:hypothetical protein
MKNNKLTIFLIILILLFSCAEGKKTDNSSVLGALFIINGCSATTVGSIDGTSRTQYDFSSCTNPSALQGFSVSNITSGLTGTSSNSKLASTGTFGSSDFKINIEVTYSLLASTSNLDVIALGTGNGVDLVGPGFRISPSDIKYLNTSGTATLFGTGTSPTTTVGNSTTLCLEVHKEGAGSHIFGWAGACKDVADRSSYTFEEEDVVGAVSDRKIGFVLNNAVLSKIIVSNGKIGTAGSLLSF